MSDRILHLPSWAQSAGKMSLDLWSSGHNDGSRPVLFVGGVHGDEPEGVRLAEELLLWLRRQQNLELRSWALIPCLNPDGYHRRERTNANGVDLNRNFPTPDWSPAAKAPRYHPGRGPGSEPEVQALCHWITQNKPALIVHFHSWKPCVVYTGAPGAKAAQILSPGPEYPVSEDIGYPTPGSLGQYGWFVHQIPVICIEEQERTALPEVWPHFASGLQTLLQTQTNLL